MRAQPTSKPLCSACTDLVGAGQTTPPHALLTKLGSPPPMLGVYPQESTTVFSCQSCGCAWFLLVNRRSPKDGGWFADQQG